MTRVRHGILALPVATVAAALIAAVPASAQLDTSGSGAAGTPGGTSGLVGSGAVGTPTSGTSGGIVSNWINTISSIPSNYANLIPNSIAHWTAIFTGQPVR